ncbi:hypothetical protein EPI10_024045 [Gossypium australe]|uniref:Uncharacterized protein n=1 Tax=Gossypium australe TaxID=47621 RepID=A0A5B6VXH7_9ROSI|nr:hypothetical protein EPI10_024045 [Gossypium australe]
MYGNVWKCVEMYGNVRQCREMIFRDLLSVDYKEGEVLFPKELRSKAIDQFFGISRNSLSKSGDEQ